MFTYTEVQMYILAYVLPFYWTPLRQLTNLSHTPHIFHMD